MTPHGEVHSVAIGKDQFFVDVTTDPDLTIEARSLSDGNVRWTRVFKDATRGFRLGATTDGVLVPYKLGDDNPHLALLSAADGSIRWDVPQKTYDVYGEMAIGIGSIDTGDQEHAFVDLRNGAVTPDDHTWLVIGDQMAHLDGAKLRIGASPFDSSAAAKEITLPFKPDYLLDGGDVLIALSNTSVVGLVAGVERWRIQSPIADVWLMKTSGLHHLVVVGHQDQPPYYVPNAALRYDTKSATVIGMAPDGFVADQNAEVDGRPLVLGTIDTTPESTSMDELIQLVVLELEDNAVTQRAAIMHTDWFHAYVVDNHVVVPTTGTIEVWSLPDLQPEPALTIPGGCTECDQLQYVEADDQMRMLVVDEHNTINLVS